MRLPQPLPFPREMKPSPLMKVLRRFVAQNYVKFLLFGRLLLDILSPYHVRTVEWLANAGAGNCLSAWLPFTDRVRSTRGIVALPMVRWLPAAVGDARQCRRSALSACNVGVRQGNVNVETATRAIPLDPMLPDALPTRLHF